MTAAELAADAEQQRFEREARRLSYRGTVPEDAREEYDRLTRRMDPVAATAVLRDRARRRAAEAALPAAEVVIADLRRF